MRDGGELEGDSARPPDETPDASCQLDPEMLRVMRSPDETAKARLVDEARDDPELLQRLIAFLESD